MNNNLIIDILRKTLLIIYIFTLLIQKLMENVYFKISIIRKPDGVERRKSSGKERVRKEERSDQNIN